MVSNDIITIIISHKDHLSIAELFFIEILRFSWVSVLNPDTSKFPSIIDTASIKNLYRPITN